MSPVRKQPVQRSTGFNRKNTRGFNVKPPDPTKGVVPEPKEPGRLSSPPANVWSLKTTAGALSFTATKDGAVTGGGPVVVSTEIEGREPATSLGDVTGLTATLEIIVSGRIDGRIVQPEVLALFRAWEAGRLVRVYGPFDRPGIQGKVWALGEPTFTDSARNSGGKLTHAMLTVPLTGWSKSDPVTIKPGDVLTKVRDTKRRKVAVDRAEFRKKAYGNLGALR